MATRDRPAHVGDERARRIVADLAQELRSARLDRNLSQRAVAAAVGCSNAQVSRVERALVPEISVRELARLLAAVGLELSARAYAGGAPIRDAGQGRVLERLHRLLVPSLRWALEVALPVPGDQRAWDATIGGRGWLVGVEAETRPRDLQALLRRCGLKQRDGRVDAVILLLPETRHNRAFITSSEDALRAAFPVPAGVALRALAQGHPPAGNALIVL